MRKLKPNEYQCARCKGVFKKGVSDEEAANEANELYPGLMQATPEERATICDDCFKEFRTWERQQK
jgi:hypothetical protein